jgi:hypothetical protein
MIIPFSTPDEQKSASQLIDEFKHFSNVKREEFVISKIIEGHVPSKMRNYVEIQTTFFDSTKLERRLLFYVTSDYLSIGTDEDNLRFPLSPVGAQIIADEIDCIFPTTKIVNLIWENGNKIPPQPWGPPFDSTMSSTDRIVKHDENVNKKILELGYDQLSLLVGHKKDVVITRKLEKNPKQVAIYGWHQTSSIPIQPLYLGHSNDYLDYSHGNRYCSRICFLDGYQDDLARILCDENLCLGVSSEGTLKSFRQP